MSIFLDRVALAVEGGERGALGPNLGAIGVEISSAWEGVKLLSSNRVFRRVRGVEIMEASSMSVSASSSSTTWLLRSLDRS